MRYPLTLLLLAVSLGLAAPAMAQGKRAKKSSKTEKAEAAKDAAPKERAPGEELQVLILKFENFKTPDSVMAILYQSLEEGIKNASGLSTTKPGTIVLNDLVITLGCKSANKECLQGLQEYIEADRIIFGSVQTEGDIYMFNIKVFDFAQGDFIARIEDQTVEGDEKKLREVIPALVEAVLYGNVGKISVTSTGVESPEVFVDGKKVGRSPLDLDGLALGEHNIVVKDERGEERSQVVTLRKDVPAMLNFEFSGAVATLPEESGTSSALLIPGWIAVGVGVAGTAFGVYNQLELSSQEDAASSFKGRTSATQAEASGVRDRYDKMQSLNNQRVIGYTIGGIGLVTGITMLVLAYTGDDDNEASNTALKLPLQITPTAQGVHVGFDWSF
jgi:hypothetical protein